MFIACYYRDLDLWMVLWSLMQPGTVSCMPRGVSWTHTIWKKTRIQLIICILLYSKKCILNLYNLKNKNKSIWMIICTVLCSFFTRRVQISLFFKIWWVPPLWRSLVWKFRWVPDKNAESRTHLNKLPRTLYLYAIAF